MSSVELDQHIIELTHEFFESLEEDLAFLEEEILNLKGNGGNIRPAYAKVHSIKGSAGALGLPFISTVCHTFEDYLEAAEEHLNEAAIDKLLKFIDLLRDYKKAALESPQIKLEKFEHRLQELKGRGSQDTQHRRILVVQKSKSLIRRYRQICDEIGVEVSTARNGLDALSRLLKEPFDAVICDVRLEQLDGDDLCFIIRHVKSMNKNLATILVSSDERITKDPKSPADHIILKNIDYFSNVRSLFFQVFGKENPEELSLQAGKTSANSSSSETPRLVNIACIDDDRLIQSLIKASLKTLDLDHLGQAYCAEEGIQLVQLQKPQLVILDYMLPDADGPFVFEDLRRQGYDGPIIFLTGKTKPEEIESLMKLGALAVVNKPFEPTALAKVISDLWIQYYSQASELKEGA